jgi:hypothetical protein
VSSNVERDIDNALTSKLKGQHGRSVGRTVADVLKRVFENIKPRSSGSATDFQRDMEQATSERHRPGQGRVFLEANQTMIQLLAQMVWIDDPMRVQYLAPLVTNPNVRVIATLNYDNAIELAASSCGIPCDTGIDEWSQSGLFSSSDDGLSLLKLHGSIDWALKSGTVNMDRPMPFQEIVRIEPEKIKQLDFTPAVIFGSRNKLTAAGPYLELLRTFARELNLSERLTVVGYSFRDEHINEYLRQWINGDSKRTLRIINGPTFNGADSAFAQHLIQALKARVELVGAYAATGIDRCFGNAVHND